MKKLILILFLFYILFNTFLYAAPKSRDSGFLFRVLGGLSFGNMNFLSDNLATPDKFTINTGFSPLDLDFGYVVSKNLAIHVGLSFLSYDLKFKSNGTPKESSSTPPNYATITNKETFKFSSTAINLGLSYYFPNDIYIRPTITLSQTSSFDYKLDEDYYFYNTGDLLNRKLEASFIGSKALSGASFAVGKEWWVSDHWGLGVVGYLSYGEFTTVKFTTTELYTNKLTGAKLNNYVYLPSANIDYLILGVAFSATYN